MDESKFSVKLKDSKQLFCLEIPLVSLDMQHHLDVRSPDLHVWQPECVENSEVESRQLGHRVRGVEMLRNVLGGNMK